MSSLSAHLRQPEDHSRLPFHPACPVCRRERLAGSLDGEELVSRRTQAAIAAGLLAFSTAGIPAAAAQEPDAINEGTAEVVDDSSSDVDAELDGEALQLTDEAPATPEAVLPPSSSDDDGPLEQDMATEMQGSAVDTTENAAAEVPEEAPPAAEPEVATPPPAATPAPVTTPAESGAASDQDAGPVAVAPERREQIKAVEHRRSRPAPAAAPAPARALAGPAPAPAPVPVVAAADPAPAETVRVVVARSSGSGADSGDRFHTVRTGESLWSIASDLLGERATVPRIAREVNRLWELNDERIGTGRPDLLFAGTRLRLR
jgi:hypothetical protein